MARCRVSATANSAIPDAREVTTRSSAGEGGASSRCPTSSVTARSVSGASSSSRPDGSRRAAAVIAVIASLATPERKHATTTTGRSPALRPM